MSTITSTRCSSTPNADTFVNATGSTSGIRKMSVRHVSMNTPHSARLITIPSGKANNVSTPSSPSKMKLASPSSRRLALDPAAPRTRLSKAALANVGLGGFGDGGVDAAGALKVVDERGDSE